MDERRARHGEQTFVYREHGPADGAPVVLLHGFPDGPESWDPTADVLVEAGHRVVAPYLRGYHPDTVVAGRGYTADEQGADVVALLDALGLDDVVLVGHDWGASHVYAAAAIAPGRLRAIVPIAIPHPRALKPSAGALWAVRHFVTFASPLGEALARRDGFAYLDRLLDRWAPTWSGPDRDALLAAAKARFADPSVLREAVRYYKDLRPRPSRLMLRRTEARALVVAGSEDFGGNVRPYLDSAGAFDPPAEVAIVEGAGHWPHLERPEAFRARLLAFLDGLP